MAPALVVPAALATPGAAAAPSSEVVIIDLPERQRAEPRVVRLVGETDDFGVALVRESDTGAWEGLLVADDGSTRSIPTDVDAVFGNRLVRAGDAGEVLTRVLPTAEWTRVSVPAGRSLVRSTEHGLLLATTSAPLELSLLPWSGGDPRPVAGAPEGLTGISRSRAGDASVSVVPVSGAGAVEHLVVDSGTRQAWPLAVSRSGCGTGYNTSWAVNDGTIAWRSETTSGDAVICTMPLLDTGGLGAASSRPAPVDTAATREYQFALTPVGEEVVVARVRQPRPLAGQDQSRPVDAVRPDGSTRRLAAWGQSVAVSRPGHLLLVGGESRADTAVRRIPVAGPGGELVLSLPPKLARVGAMSVDDGRVVYRDQSELGDAIVEAELDTVLNRVTHTRLLDSWVSGGVAAQEGATAWFSHRADTGHAKLRRAGSSEFVPDATRSGSLSTTAAVSGDHVLASPVRLVDFGRGSVAALRTSGTDLQDGVLYLSGSATTNGPTGSVIARDLRTGLAEQIDVPTCAEIHSLQVAGSWLLVHCTRRDGTHPRIVVDRSEAVAPFEVASAPGALRLGNGFLARRESLNPLEWAPLHGGAMTWRQVDGSVPVSFAVSRGQVPLLAWSSGSGRVARLPVVASAMPAKPDDVAPPASPEVTVTALDRRLQLDWGPAPAGSRRTAVILRVDGTRSVLPGAATGTSLSLPNGVEETVEVTFENIAGSASSTVVGTPLAPPAAPSLVRVDVDRSTSKADVTWAWSPTQHSEPLESFEVWAGTAALVTGLQPGTRSVTVPWDGADDGRLSVRAVGPHQVSASTAAARVDRVAPTASIESLQTASSRRFRTLRLRASDDLALARKPIDVRWRSGRAGSPMGRWTAPSHWQRVEVEPLRVTGLRRGWRYCFSVRAHDRAGNVSPWSSRVCTRVTR